MQRLPPTRANPPLQRRPSRPGRGLDGRTHAPGLIDGWPPLHLAVVAAALVCGPVVGANAWAARPSGRSLSGSALADGNAVAEVPAETAAPPADGGSPMLHGHGRPIEGVDVHLRVWLKDQAKAEAAVAAALKEVRRISRKMSTERRRSEIDGVNRLADREEVILSRETYDLVQRALHLCELTGGAFDLTVQSFDYLWNFKRRPPVRPLDDEIKARLAVVGCNNVLLKPNRAIRVHAPRVRITLADLLHGHAMVTVSRLLLERGIDSFRLRIGQDVYVRGRTGTRHWYVAVPHPLKRDREIVQLYLTSHVAATRSVTDRYFMKDGKRYHDVLNPRTGRPVEGVLQATVIGTDTVLADALSTAMLVLGPKAGIALLNKTDNIDGFIIDTKGRVYGSSGMSDFARLPKSIDL